MKKSLNVQHLLYITKKKILNAYTEELKLLEQLVIKSHLTKQLKT